MGHGDRKSWDSGRRVVPRLCYLEDGGSLPIASYIMHLPYSSSCYDHFLFSEWDLYEKVNLQVLDGRPLVRHWQFGRWMLFTLNAFFHSLLLNVQIMELTQTLSLSQLPTTNATGPRNAIITNPRLSLSFDRITPRTAPISSLYLSTERQPRSLGRSSLWTRPSLNSSSRHPSRLRMGSNKHRDQLLQLSPLWSRVLALPHHPHFSALQSRIGQRTLQARRWRVHSWVQAQVRLSSLLIAPSLVVSWVKAPLNFHQGDANSEAYYSYLFRKFVYSECVISIQ